MKTKSFNCTMGRREKTFTWFILIFMLGIPLINMTPLINKLTDTNKSNMIVTMCIFVLLLAIVTLVYSLTPQKVTVGKDTVTVKRKLRDYIIPTENIIAIGRKKKKAFRSDIRLVGAAGLFGYYGSFRSKEHGKYYCISNNENNNIIIVTTKGTYVVSCDNPQEIMEEISKYM